MNHLAGFGTWLSAATPLVVGVVFLLAAPSAPYSRVDYLVWSVGAALAVLASSALARWDVFGVVGCWGTAAVLAITAAIRWYVAGAIDSSWLPSGRIAASALLVGLCSLAVLAWVSKRPSLPPVELQSPIDALRWYVVQGGDTALTNHHAPVPAQRYALDLTVVAGDGRRATALWPTRVGDYRAYGIRVVAPCSGVVVAAEVSHLDQEIGRIDGDNPAGNFVAIECDGALVVLAHLQAHSVSIELGTTVAAGQEVGRMGNSGNTSEPHLHLHAVRGPFTTVESLLFRGEGLPMTIGGAWLRRGAFGP